MGCVVPKSEFLSGLRRLCDEYGSLLIMDEVMTGFRVLPLGAQGRFDVSGDITCFGKIIGGGMPVGTFGGRADLMDNLSPSGNIYQAGTLSSNPIAMIAGLTTLQKLDHVGFYDELADQIYELVSRIKSMAKDSDLPIVVNSVCGMFSIFITENKSICDYGDVADCDN
jgi:glutamate-1-semialdehyde 2,1-aminomutase